jgi:hypothetical protein
MHQFFRKFTPKAMPVSGLKTPPDFTYEMREAEMGAAMNGLGILIIYYIY